MVFLALASTGHGSGVWQLFLQVPPLHPILVNLTAGLIPAAMGFDLLGRWLRRESLASAGFWTTIMAAAVTPFTALAGWLWLGDMGGHGQVMTIHKWLGTVFAVLMLGLGGWRWYERRREMRPDSRPGPRTPYLSVTALLVLTLVAQGHIGGMMSFGPIGGQPHSSGEEQESSGDNSGSEKPADDGWKAAIKVGGAEASTGDTDGKHAH